MIILLLSLLLLLLACCEGVEELENSLYPPHLQYTVGYIVAYAMIYVCLAKLDIGRLHACP